MNKILLIGDLHLNYRSIFIQDHLDFFNENYDKVFQNLLNIVKRWSGPIVFTGDTIDPFPLNFDFDNILKLFNTLQNIKENPIYFIIGNHDIYFRNTRNSLLYTLIKMLKETNHNIELVEFEEYKKIADNVYLCGGEFNLSEFVQKLHNSIIITHQEIHQLDPNDNLLISGHIHNPTKYPNSKKFFYIGAISPMNFRDAFDFIPNKLYKFNYGLISLDISNFSIKRISLDNKINFYKAFIEHKAAIDNISKVINENKDIKFVMEFQIANFNFDFSDLNYDNLIFRIKPIFEAEEISPEQKIVSADIEKSNISNIIKEALHTVLSELDKYPENLKEEILQELLK